MAKEAIKTPSAPAAVGPYSQAIRNGGWLFLSGQIGLAPTGGSLVAGGVEAEARQIMRNIAAILSAAGASTSDICKTTIYLTDLADFALVNQVYEEAIEAPLPARSTVQVAGLPLGAKVEIEVIAHAPH